MRIDLNGDVGESYGPWTMGDDAAFVPLLTSANIACGAHAGDPLVMARTVRLATADGVAVGAHPGYPDRDGFGRRDLEMASDELEASLLAQLGALAAIARAEGVAALSHVKPHGALYNRAARDARVAEVVARAVRRFSGQILLVGLAGSVGLDVARACGLRTAAEAFADRRYEPDGSLRSRRLDGSVLPPGEAAEQAVGIVRDGTIVAVDGSRIAVAAETLCVHGDTPGAADVARAVRAALAAAGVEVAPLPRA